MKVEKKKKVMDEKRLPTKEEMSQWDEIMKPYWKLMKGWDFSPEKMIPCMNCHLHQEEILLARKLWKKQPEWTHEKETEKKRIYEVWSNDFDEKVPNVNDNCWQEADGNRQVGNLYDYNISLIVKGHIVIDYQEVREKDDEISSKGVVGLLFLYEKEIRFICKSCWNALISLPEIKKVFPKENLRLLEKGVPNTKLLHEGLKKIIGVVK